ncbi:MAG TPA: alpha-amylase family glycosyl hydrolase [Anaerolineales bacterium]|nr:alpha-amylase family glycosyl hydrolase [Anaerolineales bacterium]
MMNRSLNRREFLRLSIVLAGSAWATACGPGRSTLTPTVVPTLSLPSGIKLTGDDADAWAFVKQIRGSMSNPAVCQAVWVENEEARAQTAPQENFFSAEVLIRPGANPIHAVCQHPDQEEELSPEITINGRLPQRPTAIISPSLVQGLVILNGSSTRPDEVEAQPIREFIWSARADNPAIVRVQVSADQEQQEFRSEVRGERIEIEPPPQDGEYYVSLRVIDEAGREDKSTTYFVVENGQPRIPDYDHENPAWVDQAIVYGVIPRVFGTPGAEAIQYRLDELADLGITAMWLAPVNDTNDYGYSVLDYFELRDNFGSKEEFRALVQAAHERGIRLLMDFVPNHTSNEHPYFKDTVEKGQNSPYWDFYDRDANGDYTYYFDWTHLPNLNYENVEVRRMMIEAFSYWVREFDVDGFRVDACWGVKQRRPDFWPEWRRELKRIKPDLFLLAEASARDPYYFDNGFDAAYDWTENLGNWSWARFWGEQAEEVDTAQTIESLKNMLLGGSDTYHPDALIFRFLNNNDTGTRFITTHGEPLTRVATALLLTLPGVPCIYTADEAGQWFRPYFDVTPISFRERYRGLRDYHKKLISLRKGIPSLHSRLWQLLDVQPESQVMGYVRFLEGNEQPVLVLLSFSEEAATVTLPLPKEFQTLTGTLLDVLNDEEISFNATNSIAMDPMSARILIVNKES